MNKPPITQCPLSYFEHNERKSNPETVQLDIIEWPEPVEVKEHTSAKDEWAFRKAWLNRIRGNSK